MEQRIKIVTKATEKKINEALHELQGEYLDLKIEQYKTQYGDVITTAFIIYSPYSYRSSNHKQELSGVNKDLN